MRRRCNLFLSLFAQVGHIHNFAIHKPASQSAPSCEQERARRIERASERASEFSAEKRKEKNSLPTYLLTYTRASFVSFFLARIHKLLLDLYVRGDWGWASERTNERKSEQTNYGSSVCVSAIHSSIFFSINQQLVAHTPFSLLLSIAS